MSEPSEPARTQGPPLPFVERRENPRRSTAMPIRYRGVHADNLTVCQQTYRRGVCRNISQGGMLLEVEGHLAPGQAIEVYATDREKNATIYCIVETVRTARTPDHYEIGVRFLIREDV